MGVMIGLFYILLVMKGALKDIDKRITTLVSMLVMLGVVWFIDDIIADLFWIIASGIIGYVLYLILYLFGKKDLDYYKAYRNEKARVVARQETSNIIEGV